MQLVMFNVEFWAEVNEKKKKKRSSGIHLYLKQQENTTRIRIESILVYPLPHFQFRTNQKSQMCSSNQSHKLPQF